MQLKLPETKNEIKANELIAALSGRSFNARPWFYTATRSAIKQDGDIASYGGWLPDDELEYIVLKEAICKVNQYDHLLLEKIGGGNKRGFLFYKSILPEFIVRESVTLDWLIIQTHIQHITIESNSRLGDINIRENSHSGHITISDNSVVGRIRITKYSQAGIIGIYANGQCRDIDISEYSQSDHIFLEDSHAKDIKVSDNSKIGVLNIRESKIRGITVEKNSETGTVGMSLGSQSEHLFVLDNSRTGPVVIGDNSKIEHLIFRTSKSVSIGILEGVQCESLDIKGNSHVGRLQVRGAQVKDIYIEHNHCSIQLLNATVPIMRVNKCHIDELKWQAGTRGELYITNSLINHLNLSNTALVRDAALSLTNCSIHIIQLQELIVQGILILRNIKGSKELFTWQPEADENVKEAVDGDIPYSVEQGLKRKHNDFIENLKTRFKKGPLFIIANSSLGKTEITGSDLELFRLEYRDSRLLDIFISGTKLPPTNIYCPSDDPLPLRDLFEQKVAIYNQLKRIFDNQGDIVEAAQYHSRAMDSQKNLLKLIYRENHSPRWYSFNKWFTDEGFDLFGFRLNRLSNNHGESWRRALGFTIGISLFLYTCYYASLNYYKDFSITWKAFGDFIGNYFSFLDLTHKIDFMVDKSEMNATARFLDFLGRIAIGYGIYQFVAAFRRHVKK